MPLQRIGRTEKGLRYVSWALLLNLVGLALLFSAGLALTVSMGAGGVQDFGSFVVPFVGSILLICGGGAIVFISAFLFLVGFYHAYEGKEEYGGAHRANLVRSLMLLVVYIGLAVAGFVVGFVVDPSMSSTSPEDLQISALASLPFNLVSTIVLALIILFTIKELATKLLIKVVWAALVVSLMGVGVAFFLEGVVLPETLTRLDTTQLGTTFGLLGPSLLASSIQILAGILYLLAVRETWKRVREGDVELVAPVAPEPGAGAYVATSAQPVAPPAWTQPPAQWGAAAAAAPPEGWRFCPQCGIRVEGFSFCPLCGLRTKTPPPVDAAPGDSTRAPGPEEE
jgi:hypothetical protein